MRRELEKEKSAKQSSGRKKKRSGKDEKESEPGAILTKLLCHKHKLSNVTAATEADGVKKTGVGNQTAFDLERAVAKGFRVQSSWGHSRGAAFTLFCKSKGEVNWLARLPPSSKTRHHLRFGSFVLLFLAISTLQKYLETAAPKAKRATTVAAGAATANKLNKDVLAMLNNDLLVAQLAVLAKLHCLCINPVELAASNKKYLGVESNLEMGPKVWQVLRQGLKLMVQDPMPYLTGAQSIYDGFQLRGNLKMKILVERSTVSLPEQARQCKIIAGAMLKALKKHCSDFIIPGQFADPSPELIAQFKHVKPTNDAVEHDFGIVDYQVHRSRRQTTERTDAKLKIQINQPFAWLWSLSPQRRELIWRLARKEWKSRAKVERERKIAFEQGQIANMMAATKKGERKEAKAIELKREHEGVELARTVEDLDSLLKGINNEKLGAQILRKQIQQLTGVHGVSKHLLPLRKNGQTLKFTPLYNNLRNLLEVGDPLTVDKAELRKKLGKKRGRPASASEKERARKKSKLTNDENAY